MIEGIGLRKYIAGRLVGLFFVLLGVTFFTFFMMQFAADDAVDKMYDDRGAVPEELKAERRHELGLDRPFFVQYGTWLMGLASGDMGKSFISGKDVFETFIEKLPQTIWLMAVSILMTLTVSLPLGIISAVKRDESIDYIIRFFSFIGNSLPNFFTALLLIYFLALKMNLLPIMGNSENMRSVILPALTLAIAMGAKYTRQMRTAILEEMNKPYVAGARSRGVAESTILFKSVLRSSLVPLITLLALSIGSLLGGTAIVETIFMWDGVGKMAVDAIIMRDYPIIQAYVVWMSIIYVVVNLIADIMCDYFDPRAEIYNGGGSAP